MTVSAFNNLSFEENTDPEVIRYTHSQNASSWKGKQTVDEYCEREHLLGTSNIGKKGQLPEMRRRFPVGFEMLGLKYFVLKNKDLALESKTSQIVASCEALCRLGYAIHARSNGKIVQVLTVCIGGVYTVPAHRGKGFARVMIRKLNEYFDRRSNDPDAPEFLRYTVMTLYSEVGEYYAKSGYYSLHVPLHIVTRLDEMYERYCDSQINQEGRFLGFDDYRDLVDLQGKQFKSQLLQMHKKFPAKFLFTVAPDIDIYKWFQIRDKFMMEKTKRFQSRLLFGFALNDSSHVIWHHNWNDDSLIILKIFITESTDSQASEKVLKELLAHAITETKACGLKNLVFWDEEIPIKEFPKLFSLLSGMGHESKVFAQNSSLSAVRPPNGYKIDDVVWANNTKFCWF